MEFLANDNGILEIINLINEVYKDDADLRIALIKTMRITELIKVNNHSNKKLFKIMNSSLI